MSSRQSRIINVGAFVKSTDPFDKSRVFEVLCITDLGVVESRDVRTREVVWRHKSQLKVVEDPRRTRKTKPRKAGDQMNLWDRVWASLRPIRDERALRSLGGASDPRKEQWHRQRLSRVKHDLDPELVAHVEAASDEENEAAIAEEIRKIKARSLREWKLLLSSLPTESQKQLRDIEHRFHV